MWSTDSPVVTESPPPTDVDVPDGFAGVVVEGIVGRGASSIVYVGVQSRFNRRVAIKVLDVGGQSSLVRQLFVNECRTLGRLTPHPNIVTVFDGAVTPDGSPYLVMEYLPGGTLADRLRQSGPFDPTDVLRIGVVLCGALQTAHDALVIHGDVKPQNVLWTHSDEPALADFGISRMVTSSSSGSTRMPVLTPLHAAPELFDGASVSVASDIYELGSTLFELLEGRPAAGTDADSPMTIVKRAGPGGPAAPGSHPGRTSSGGPRRAVHVRGPDRTTVVGRRAGRRAATPAVRSR